MINKDRIVPIQKQDLITMYGTIFNMHQLLSSGDPIEILAAPDVAGDFELTETINNIVLANQPVKSLDFASGVSAGAVAFVPAYDYAGITVAGAAATIAEGSATIKPDGASLYVATLVSGEVTIKEITPEIGA